MKNGYEAAHKLHSGNCGCKLPKNLHKTKKCPLYIEFMKFLRTKDPDEAPTLKPVDPDNVYAAFFD